jgi:hypothetical protein
MGFWKLVKIRNIFRAHPINHAVVFLQIREVYIKIWPFFRRPARVFDTVARGIVKKFDPLSVRDPQTRVSPGAFVKGFKLSKTSSETSRGRLDKRGTLWT